MTAEETGPAVMLGVSGLPVPFTGLVSVSREQAVIAQTRVRLKPSTWLDGLTAAALPSPLAIISDIALGTALFESSGEPFVTEGMRIDVLDAHGDELETVAKIVGSAGRRHIAQGVIRDGASGAVVAHAVGRLVVLGQGSGQPAPGWPLATQAPTVRELLNDAVEVTRIAREAVRLRVSLSGDLGNSYGYLHGGAAAVLCDVGLYWLRKHIGGELCVSRVQDMSLNYVAPVPLTAAVDVSARVTENSGTRVTVAVSIAPIEDRAAVVANYTLRVRNPA